VLVGTLNVARIKAANYAVRLRHRPASTNSGKLRALFINPRFASA
jgi:hypothetical protein